MEHQEPYRAIAYQRKMQALYNHAAADVFRQQYYPADPFDGVLIGAEFLEISELVNIFKATKALEDEGNAPFVDSLIHFRGKCVPPAVRVNEVYLDGLRVRKVKICEYLHKALFDTDSVEDALWCEQEIAQMNDPQLTEYLRQAQEALAFEVEVIIDAKD